MLCLLLIILITFWTQINKDFKENLKTVGIIDHQQQTSVQIDQSHFTELKAKHCKQTDHGNPITYTSEQLRRIGNNFLLNPKQRSVPNYDTLRTIKRLKINRRRIRLQHWSKQRRREALMTNLSDISPDPETPVLNNKNMTFRTVNARSLKSSINQIMDLLIREALDFLLVTETWLKPSDEAWLKSQGLHSIGYKYSEYHRPGNRKGGGIMLIHKPTITVKNTSRLNIPFTEAAIWSLMTKKHSFNLLGVYHPPPHQQLAHLISSSLKLLQMLSRI